MFEFKALVVLFKALVVLSKALAFEFEALFLLKPNQSFGVVIQSFVFLVNSSFGCLMQTPALHSKLLIKHLWLLIRQLWLLIRQLWLLIRQLWLLIRQLWIWIQIPCFVLASSCLEFKNLSFNWKLWPLIPKWARWTPNILGLNV